MTEQCVGRLPLFNRDPVVAEKLHRDAAAVSDSVSRAEVFADQIVLGKPVAEVVVNTSSTRLECSPEAMLADVVHRVAC